MILARGRPLSSIHIQIIIIIDRIKFCWSPDAGWVDDDGDGDDDGADVEGCQTGGCAMGMQITILGKYRNRKM